MKKTILALAIIMVFAASSFASVSFLTAPGLGAGKYDLMGAYGSGHFGTLANSDTPQDLDLTALGIKGSYGIMDGLDLVVGLASNTAVNLKGSDIGGTQNSGSTIGIGVKYSIPKSVNTLPIDAAVLVGYEQTALAYKTTKTISTSQMSYALGLILSKEIGICVPYGGIAVKSLSNDLGKSLGVTCDPVGGTGLALNLGVWVGIAANQAVAIEYDTENDSLNKVTSTHGVKITDDSSATSVSGLSLGYVYMF